MRTKMKASASRTPTATPHADPAAAAGGSGGVTSTATPDIGVVDGASPTIIATSGKSGFDYLGWFTVDAEGCIVQFGVEQQRYRLEAGAPNYNALFSMLLACWIERHKVNLTYASPLLGGLHASLDAPDPPLRITSLVTI